MGLVIPLTVKLIAVLAAIYDVEGLDMVMVLADASLAHPRVPETPETGEAVQDDAMVNVEANVNLILSVVSRALVIVNCTA